MRKAEGASAIIAVLNPGHCDVAHLAGQEHIPIVINAESPAYSALVTLAHGFIYPVFGLRADGSARPTVILSNWSRRESNPGAVQCLGQSGGHFKGLLPP